MNWDKLYDLAFRFKATKLWKRIYDNQFFAVKHADGELSYVSVMGMLGDFYGLTAQVGAEGLYNLIDIGDRDFREAPWEMAKRKAKQSGLLISYESSGGMPPEELARVRAYCKSRGIKLNGPNAWPSLNHMAPFCMPWTLQEADELRTVEVLEAALYLAETVKGKSFDKEVFPFIWQAKELPVVVRRGEGLALERMPVPERPEEKMPDCAARNELLLARVRKQKKRVGVWNCAAIVHPTPFVSEELPFGQEPEEAPKYAMFLMVQNDRDGKVLDILRSKPGPDYAQELMDAFLTLIEQAGRPQRVQAFDAYTEALLKDVGRKLNMAVDVRHELPQLKDAMMDYYEHFSAREDDWEDEDPAASPRITEEEKQSVQSFWAMPEIMENVHLLPDEAIQQMMHMMTDVPPEKRLAQRLFEEWSRRFLK